MSFQVDISVDAKQELGPLVPIYRFFGADEPNYVYMKDGERLIRKLGQLGSEQVFFRVHSLLVTGDGTPALKWGSTNAYTEDKHGNPVYDWTIVDHILETGLERGVKPYLQLGFMPKALSTAPKDVPYQHSWTSHAEYKEIYTGWAYPPKDYQKWGELVYQLTKHCVEKYGRTEAESWYWEVWNEPNIGYWQGTPEEFYKLHDYATAAVRRALPTAKVGGPEIAHGAGLPATDPTATGPNLKQFLDHCVRGNNKATGEAGSPLDFLSFHAKGRPQYIDGHVRMGIDNHLREISNAMSVIASFPELKSLPIVIGESDPEGAAAAQGPQLGYRNSTMYSSYTAASFARKHELAAKHGVNLEGALTWAFEFEDQPYFAGFRVLASNDIDLPVLNVFRMFAKMKGSKVKTKSSGQSALESMISDGVRQKPDVGVLASKDGNILSIMIWHYHDDDLPGPPATIRLQLDGVQVNDDSKVSHFRVDNEHSNSFEVWKSMGSPQKPSSSQYAKLAAAGQLAKLTTATKVIAERGQSILAFDLPRQGVSLLQIVG